MRDNSHLSAAAGEVLGGLFSALMDRMATSQPTFAEFAGAMVASRVVPAVELFSVDRLVVRQSSLRGATYGRLLAGDLLRLPAGESERIAAIMLNTGAKGGTVAIRGGNSEVIKPLTSYWREAEPEVFSSYLVDILAPVTGGAGGITIEIVDKDRTPTEPTLMCRPVLPGRYGELEIEGVLLNATTESAQTAIAPVYDWLPLDLANLPEVSVMVGALASLRPSPGAPARETGDMAMLGTREMKTWFAGKEFTHAVDPEHFRSWSDELDSIRGQPIEILDVGAGEGRSSIFLLRYFAQGRLTAVDSFWDPSTEKRFEANTREFASRIELIKKLSLDALHALVWAARKFDVIYLDATHERDLLVIDSLLAWKLLRVGGVLIWSSYGYGDDLPDEWRPRSGIDLFLRMQIGSYKLLLKRYQVVIRRTKDWAPIETAAKPTTSVPDATACH
jgi:SAM-dependent methyltransferase